MKRRRPDLLSCGKFQLKIYKKTINRSKNRCFNDKIATKAYMIGHLKIFIFASEDIR